MESDALLLLAADVLLLVHLIFVVFVVFGLVLIIIGKPFRWSWVRNPWFRIAHLLAIGIVVVQSWIGLICPLTTWEMALRERAGGEVYAISFIAHLVETILYYQAPEWIFTLCYTVFGAAVLFSWFWIRPRGFRNHRKRGAT
jgi:hypothetical protein